MTDCAIHKRGHHVFAPDALRILVSLTFIFSLSLSSFAQGTAEDYARANAARQKFSWKLVKGYVEDARWLSDGRFQYRLTGGKDGTDAWHFGQVNADGTVSLADTTTTDPLPNPSDNHRNRWSERRRQTRGAVTFSSHRHHERHWMEVGDEREAEPVLSPDSTLAAFVRNDNLWVAKPDGTEARALTHDGTLSNYFSSYIYWSPDSRYVAACKIRPVEKRFVYYVESSPSDQLQPILHKQEYAKPGDELIQKVPYIVEVATGRVMKADESLIHNQYSLSGPEWREDSKGIRFEYNQRGHKLYRIYEMSAETGQMLTLVEEAFKTYVRYSNYYRHNIDGDNKILWLSERDGYPHLYLFDATSAQGGKPQSRKRAKPLTFAPHTTWCGAGHETGIQLTKGKWCVRKVLNINEEQGFVIFTGNGRNADEDPYHIHYYRINLDGTGLTDLTPEKGNHIATFNNDYTWLIDTYSTMEQAPITKIRPTHQSIPSSDKDGEGFILSTSDISELKALGWQQPEVFVALGRDGKTPMWGIIQRPSNFNPSHSYPIIEYIYSGPGDSYTPKSFMPNYYYATALAELGFIVVQLDAMTTSNRGKAFEEVCYKNLKDAGFLDRIAWIRAAAAKYPYMDINRVGIYGCSAGGQESTAAMLFHGDFYKCAYSACGCHDNRMDKIWWNEQWMGYPVDSSYAACSNVENAHRLQGPLMLVVGELDDNVDPASTMQVANALINANKDFELVVLPGAHHTMGEAFGEHKRFDFFVRHLLGVQPPKW